ncbi:ABC transporter permease [Actinomadura alba]|uniref:ABC transporter permease n=1 Tax=Actinomadura alba TaxID=406431 RepID=A0ABR7LM89_9ACTN|nr:ABC transporter permease [Actinomadura alba]MBC6465965.1 ABC transporter permease [Actinomadura alba]
MPRAIRGVLFSPIVFALVTALAIGAVMLAVTGANPLTAYQAIVTGALGADGIGNSLTQAVPVTGMALALAIPLRAGLVNLGGDGQLVLGGITAAAVGLASPLPGPLTLVLAILAGMAAGALYAALAAVCENRFGVPLLVSSLLLSYPAMSAASYLARFPLKEEGSSLPQTRQLPDGVHLPSLGSGTLNAGLFLVAAVVIAYAVIDARTPTGFEIRMTGRNARFATYAGVDRPRLTLRLMAVSGAVAGLVGSIGVLSFPYRFIDGALITPNYTWTGLLAALLAGAAPLGTLAAAVFFAAMTTGGAGMERVTEVPREITTVLQALIIVFLAVRTGIFRRQPRGDS